MKTLIPPLAVIACLTIGPASGCASFPPTADQIANADYGTPITRDEAEAKAKQWFINYAYIGYYQSPKFEDRRQNEFEFNWELFDKTWSDLQGHDSMYGYGLQGSIKIGWQVRQFQFLIRNGRVMAAWVKSISGDGFYLMWAKHRGLFGLEYFDKIQWGAISRQARDWRASAPLREMRREEAEKEKKNLAEINEHIAAGNKALQDYSVSTCFSHIYSLADLAERYRHDDVYVGSWGPSNSTFTEVRVALEGHTDLTFALAKTALARGDLDLADRTYRYIIGFYSGLAYAGIRERVRIGIDDVREARR